MKICQKIQGLTSNKTPLALNILELPQNIPAHNKTNSVEKHIKIKIKYFKMYFFQMKSIHFNSFI